MKRTLNHFDFVRSPDYRSNLHCFLRKQKGDRDRWYVDWDLADIILAHCNFDWERNVFHQAMVDRRITKQFLNRGETMSQLEHFQEPQRPNFTWNRNFRSAVEFVKEVCNIQRGSLKPIKLVEENAEKLFSNLNARAGVIQPELHKRECLPEIFQVAQEMKTALKSGIRRDEVWLPALPFHRAQISGYYDSVSRKLTPDKLVKKDRLVWCIDAATVAIEMQYARPAIDHIAGSCMSYAGGLSNQEISKVFYSYCVGKSWISIDYSKFDQTIPSWLIQAIFDEIIIPWFSEAYKSELKWVRDRFIHTYILKYDGSLFQKHHGIPSGSGFTQLVGSFAHLIMVLTYLFSKFGSKEKVIAELKPKAIRYHYSSRSKYNRLITAMVMSDDGIWFTNHTIDLPDLASYVKRNFGVKINSEKSLSGNSFSIPTFLKRQWYSDGEGRDYLDMWINITHPEFNRPEGISWFIIYGIFCTHFHTMHQYFTEMEIIKAMKGSPGGLERLRSLKDEELPGSIVEFLRYKDSEYLYRRAKAFLDSRDAV